MVEPDAPTTMAHECLLTLQGLAERWNISLAAVRKMRFRKRLPKAVMIGDLPRYRQADILEWERQHMEPATSRRPSGKIRLAVFPERTAT